MKTLKALVVRTAPVLVWLACAAALAAADRPSSNSIASGYGIVPFAPAFLPSNGYTGDLALLNAPPNSLARTQKAQEGRIVLVSAEGKAVNFDTYRLRPGDKLTVAIYSIAASKALRSPNQVIDAKGNLALGSLARPVQVGGLSLKEAQAALAKAHDDQKIFIDARVFLQIEAYAPLRVDGPTEFTLPSPTREAPPEK